MKMEIAAGTMRHDNGGTSCEFLGRRPWLGAERKAAIGRLPRSVHTIAMGTARAHRAQDSEHL
jgi:hypothetical protein